MIDPSAQQERFSRAYVHAVITVAGFAMAPPCSPDDDSVDLTITAGAPSAVRRIRVELGAAEYALATRAHTEGTRLYCEGELVREGRGFLLRAPRQVSLRGDA